MRSLSDLPDNIICHIISLACLTNKEAIQLSLLSRELFRALRERPALRFDGGHKQELEYVHSTLVRYHADGIPLDTFTFKMVDELMRNLQDECITLAARLRLRHLDLQGFGYFPEPFFEVESLVNLSLEGFSLMPRVSILWPNLKRLCLVKVEMSLYDFENIIKGSPLIQNLAIIRCFHWSVDFKVSNLRNLRQLNVELSGTQTFDLMDAPALESITINTWSSIGLMHQKHILSIGLYRDIKAGLYRNLRTLSLDCVGCNDDFFKNIGDQIPRLENLSIGNNTVLRTLVISSLSLKNIRLENVPRLVEARFDVPNVVLFEYSTNEQTYAIPELSFSGNPQGWISRIKLNYIYSSIITWWFHKLNEFLRSLKMSEISITLKFLGLKSEYNHKNSHRYILGFRPEIHEFHIDSSSGFSSSSATGVVDIISSVCRPQKVTFPATFEAMTNDKKNLITSQQEIPGQRVGEKKIRFKFFGCLSPFS